MLKNLFSNNYWFELIPGNFSQTGKTAFLVLILIFLLGAIVTAIYRKKITLYRKTSSRIYDFFIINFFLALIFFFFRVEIIPFLSARFWLGIWFISLIIWLYFIFKDLKKISEKKEELEKKKEKEKYIP